MPGSGPESISGSRMSRAARWESRLPTGRSTTTSDTTSTFGARRGDQGHALVASTMSAQLEDENLSDFRAFLLKTNALALAIGVIIGTALGTVVNSLVNDILMPPIGLLLGGVDFS